MTELALRTHQRIRLIDDSRIRNLELKYPIAPQSRSTARIKIGTEGVVVATRPLIDNVVLVKFKGCRFEIQMLPTHLQPLEGV